MLFVLFFSCFLHAGNSLNGDTFDVDVIQDERVWIVEFYSHFSDASNAFTPKWRELEEIFIHIASGRVSIDDKAGMDIAESLGVLDKGLPNIQLYTGKEKVTIVAGGDSPPTSELVAKIKPYISGFVQRGDGYYLKYSESCSTSSCSKNLRGVL